MNRCSRSLRNQRSGSPGAFSSRPGVRSGCVHKPATRALTAKQRVRLTFICCSRRKARNANVLPKFTFIPIFFCIVFLAFHFLIYFTVYLPFVYSTLWPLVCERRFINNHYLLTVNQFKVYKLSKHFWNNMCWTSQITFIHICCIFLFVTTSLLKCL